MCVWGGTTQGETTGIGESVLVKGVPSHQGHRARGTQVPLKSI